MLTGPKTATATPGIKWDVRFREFQAMRNRDLKKLRAQDGWKTFAWKTENFHEENLR